MGDGELVRLAVDVVEVAVRSVLMFLLELLGVELLVVEATGGSGRLSLGGRRNARSSSGVEGANVQCTARSKSTRQHDAAGCRRQWSPAIFHVVTHISGREAHGC